MFLIQGWVARDESDVLTLFQHKPSRNLRLNLWSSVNNTKYYLPNNMYPELTWEDVSIQTTLKITPM